MGLHTKFNVSEVPGCENVTKGKSVSCGGFRCYRGTCKNPFDPWKARCECDPGWIGKRCDYCCKLPCMNKSVCEVDAADHKVFCDCFLDKRYTGAYCHILAETKTEINMAAIQSEPQSMWNPYTISLSSVLVVITVIVLMFGPVFMYGLYKRRNILVLKLFYKFKKFEDDDSKMYDVFLSYRTSNTVDRNFVIYKLLPGIERWGFTTCIDERDFIPGADIAGTIKEAIQQSRRTVIVVSPAYIKGEWPEFEVQCALTETLRKHHRIIPVIYKPIDNCKEEISPSLQHILESVTYIEWPQKAHEEKSIQEFWRRLKLSLPKKRPTLNTENVTLSITASEPERNNHCCVKCCC